MNVSTREFQLNQKEYLDKVIAGEEIVLTNRNNPVAYIIKEIPSKVSLPDESLVRLIVKMVLAELGTIPPKNKPSETSTMPVEIESPIAKELIIVPGAKLNYHVTTNKIYDELWEDFNFLPVKKERLPDGFCKVFHVAGEKKPLYSIKKFRPDGTIELEGNYCKDCIEGFKKQIIDSGGHLE